MAFSSLTGSPKPRLRVCIACALAAPGAEQTYTVVPRGAGWRMGVDRDADGYLDRDELDFGSDPANPLSLATNAAPVFGPVANVYALKAAAAHAEFHRGG